MTILYLTDSILDEKISSFCRKHLKEAAQDIPIISVSQKPIDFGQNICVGEIGRSWLNLYKQLQVGLEVIKTENVAIAEHDCLYTYEHFNFRPPRKDTFYYNHSMWLVQWGGNHPELNGMYSYWPKRKSLSQLICNAQLLRNTIKARLDYIDKDRWLTKNIIFAGEPGLSRLSIKQKIAVRIAKSGKSAYLRTYFTDYLLKEKYSIFRTKTPNLDIRHGTNFTGAKRGIRRTYELPYWGKFNDVIKNNAL